MTDRYVLTSSVEEIARLFCGTGDQLVLQAPREVAPPESAPVLRLDEGGARRLSLLRWGLVPGWAPDLSFGAICVNARSDTAMTKPAFRRALRQRRCLVPADAFHTARIENGRVETYRAERAEGGAFAFAGLWESWQSPAGETVETYTVMTAGITTTRPQGLPVVIESRNHALWLDPAPAQFDRQVRLLRPVPDAMLRLERDSLAEARFQAAKEQFRERSRRSGGIERDALPRAWLARRLVRDLGAETARPPANLQRLNLGRLGKEPA